MAIDIKDIIWLAGLLEGEGCFNLNKTTPLIRLSMTDIDVVEKARIIFGTKNPLRNYNSDVNKTTYKTTIFGSHAIQWMMTLYCLMGIRRKAKIRSIINFWMNHADGRTDLKKIKEKNFINSMRKIGISKEKAAELWNKENVEENN